jgi:integrase
VAWAGEGVRLGWRRESWFDGVMIDDGVAPAAGTAVLAELGLSADESFYAARARAKNTQRGYRSDWADFTGWCGSRVSSLPAEPETLAGYLIALAQAGARVATMAHRLSSIAYAHRLAGLGNPADHQRVQLVWEGIRREHRSPTVQAPPLMPPVLWDVVDALAPTRAGRRDAALLCVGFVGALRRSELAAVCVEDLEDHPRGLVLGIPASKTDQYAVGQVVILPEGNRAERCPVRTLQRWMGDVGIVAGPVFRPVHRAGAVAGRAMGEAAINRAVQRACDSVLGEGHGFSAHSLRAGFATYAAARGASERAIAHQTRHRDLASVGRYVRHESAWVDNAATALDL